MERMGMNGAALTSDLLSAREELAVELDFVLPDDCPDIAKLLRAGLRLGPSGTTAAEDGILAEGTILADVWYIADTGLLHRATGRTAYSKKMRCDPIPDRVAPTPTGTCEYCNARAVNQRRVECKGAMTLRADASAISSQSYLSSCEREDVEALTQTKTLVLPAARGFARAALDEERAFPDNVPAAAGILRCEQSARLTDQKAVEGRLVVKGEASVRLCCMPTEGENPFTVDFTLPFSQLLEIEGMTAESGCDVFCEFVWMDASLRSDEHGQQRQAAMQGELCISAAVHARTDLTAVIDAFGLRCKAELSPTSLMLPVLCNDVTIRQPYERSCEPPAAGASAVLDSWGTARAMIPRRTEEGLDVPVRVTTLAFLRDGNGRPAFLEKSGEISVTIPTDAGDPMLRSVEASLENLTVAIGEDAIVCRGEIVLHGCLYDRTRWDVLEGVSLDEDSPLPEPDAPLTLAWAAGEEPEWEIAKRYAVPVSGVHVEDGLAMIERV